MGDRRRAASEPTNACLRNDGAGNAQVVRTCARPFGNDCSQGAFLFIVDSSALIPLHSVGLGLPFKLSHTVSKTRRKSHA